MIQMPYSAGGEGRPGTDRSTVPRSRRRPRGTEGDRRAVPIHVRTHAPLLGLCPLRDRPAAPTGHVRGAHDLAGVWDLRTSRPSRRVASDGPVHVPELPHVAPDLAEDGERP